MAALRSRYASVDQCVENVVSETPVAWKEVVKIGCQYWNLQRIGVRDTVLCSCVQLVCLR